MNAYPDGNPKTSQGALKVPLHLVPPSSTHFLALAFKDGARKYGPYNWREMGVSGSVYFAAAKRHLDAWWDGENTSADAQVHHLAHVMACCAIMLDALTVGKLNDDRPPPGAASLLQADYVVGRALDSVSVDPPPATVILADGVSATVSGRVPESVAVAMVRDGFVPPDADEGNDAAEPPREHAA